MVNGEEQARRYKKYTSSFKRLVVETALQHGDWKTLLNTETRKVPRTTAEGWIRKAQANGNLFQEDKRRGGNKQPEKVTEAVVLLMIEAVEENAQVTLQQIKELLEIRINLTISTSTIGRHLEGRGFSVKKIYHLTDKMNLMVNKIKRKEYVEKLLEAMAEEKFIVFVDESNVNLFVRRTQGRARKGKRALIALPASKGPNLHMVAGVSLRGLHHFETKRGPFTLCAAQNWLSEMVTELSEEGIPETSLAVVVDNAPVHNQFGKFLEQTHPGVLLLRLAPYSAPLNPIENCWSILKSEIKKKLPEKMKEPIDPNLSMKEHRLRLLEDSVEESLPVLTLEKISNSICHTAIYHQPVLALEDLIPRS